MIQQTFKFPERHKPVWLMRKDGVKFLSNAETIKDPQYVRCDAPEEVVATVVPEKRKPGRPKKVQE